MFTNIALAPHVFDKTHLNFAKLGHLQQQLIRNRLTHSNTMCNKEHKRKNINETIKKYLHNSIGQCPIVLGSLQQIKSNRLTHYHTLS